MAVDDLERDLLAWTHRHWHNVHQLRAWLIYRREHPSRG